MAKLEKITFEDKFSIEEIEEIAEQNKITADNVNQIKNLINSIVDTVNGPDLFANSFELLDQKIMENFNTLENVILKIEGLDSIDENVLTDIKTVKTNIITINQTLENYKNLIDTINSTLTEHDNKFLTKAQTENNKLAIVRNDLISFEDPQSVIETLHVEKANKADSIKNGLNGNYVSLEQTDAIIDLATKTETNKNNISDLANKVQTNLSSIETNKTNLANFETSTNNSITNLNNSFTELNNISAKTNISNTFSGTQTFNTINTTQLTSTEANLQQSTITNLTAETINVSNSINLNNSPVATTTDVSNAVNGVYNTLRNYNITVWEGEWNPTTSFNKNGIVKKGSKFYLSKIKNNLNHDPETSPNEWEEFTNLNFTFNTDNLVSTNTNQDISGLKTFIVPPELNTESTRGNQLINKNYVDVKATEITTNINNNKVTTNTEQTITATKQFRNHTYIAQGPNQELGIGTLFRLGSGGNEISMTADGRGDKILKFFDSTHGNLDLKFNNRANAIIGLANPTRDDAAANKGYVDSKFAEGGGNVNLENYARKDQNNTFTGNIISTSNNNNFCSRNDAASLFKVQRGNGDDLLWIGKKDPNSNQVYISSKAEHLVIEAPAGKALRFDIPGGIQATNPLTLGTEIKMGYGASVIRMTAEDGTNKKIALGPSGGRGKLNIDLENNAKIINVPNPVTDKDVANKSYVDTKFSSINVPEVNLDNYYTKAQVDTKTNQLASDINTTNSNVRTLQSTVNQKADYNYVTNNYYTKAQVDRVITAGSPIYRIVWVNNSAISLSSGWNRVTVTVPYSDIPSILRDKVMIQARVVGEVVNSNTKPTSFSSTNPFSTTILPKGNDYQLGLLANWNSISGVWFKFELFFTEVQNYGNQVYTVEETNDTENVLKTTQD